jgi:6-phosphofructokinase
MEVDCFDDLIQWFRAHKIEALIAVGGDGSLSIAYELHKKGLCVVGVPKTIDNDLKSTTVTFGFNSPFLSLQNASTACAARPFPTGAS